MARTPAVSYSGMRVALAASSANQSSVAVGAWDMAGPRSGRRAHDRFQRQGDAQQPGVVQRTVRQHQADRQFAGRVAGQEIEQPSRS